LHDLAGQKKEIASDDGKLNVTTSGFWVKKSDLNKEAKLQLACPSKDLYLIVIGDPKATVENMTATSPNHSGAHVETNDQFIGD
jgi:hypothetical protein